MTTANGLCRNGHELSPENVYVRSDGRRQCRACNRDAVARYRAAHQRPGRPAENPCECGCGELVRRRFAAGHARRVLGPAVPAAPAIDRFMAKVSVSEDGCWEWTAARTRGYGTFFLRKRADGRSEMAYAHRWSYEHHVGPIPNDREIDHLCRNKGCVNPDHLEVVTRAENLRRIPQDARPAHMQRRTHCKKGHELSPENVWISGAGDRYCRICLAARRRAS